MWNIYPTTHNNLSVWHVTSTNSHFIFESKHVKQIDVLVSHVNLIQSFPCWTSEPSRNNTRQSKIIYKWISDFPVCSSPISPYFPQKSHLHIVRQTHDVRMAPCHHWSFDAVRSRRLRWRVGGLDAGADGCWMFLSFLVQVGLGRTSWDQHGINMGSTWDLLNWFSHK